VGFEVQDIRSEFLPITVKQLSDGGVGNEASLMQWISNKLLAYLLLV
jgi:hypothetical protein